MSENSRPITPPQMPRRGRKQDHPRMIGPWKIGRTIGRGAMGIVRIARHSKTGKYAAIKIMSKMQVIQSRCSLNKIEDEAERILLSLEREIVVMKLVDHPNIMRLYDVWETSGELYLILEYVEGGELFDYIVEKGRLSQSEALDYFQQLICAMDYCHRLNIAHRDLKPENILLDKDKVLKVADFGMAAWQSGDNLLQTSCGSPHYASPEVISSQPYDGTISDIWSCGVILYALLVGKLPFDDEDVVTLLEKVANGKFNMPTDIDPGAQDLLRKMLEKDVAKRIKISEILKHPWFTSQPQRNTDYSTPSLDEISRPIAKASDIDNDIFGNLRTLWHDAPDEDIIKNLLNEEKTWEKVVYTLLLKYRAKCTEDYNEELERARSQRRTERRQKRAIQEEGNRGQVSRSIGRPRNPALRSASQTRPTSLPPVPNVIRPVVRHHPASDTPGQSMLSPSVMTPSTDATFPLSPASPIWEALDVAPPLDVSELHEERVQRYLNDITRLLQMQNGALSPMLQNIGMPAPGGASPQVSRPLPTPGSSRIPSASYVDNLDESFVHVSRPEEQADTRGLRISTAEGSSGKENHGRIIKKSSLRKKGVAGRTALRNKHVQIILPPAVERDDRRLSCDSFTTHSPTYSISEGSSFSVPTGPKISWFTNLFKPRTETFRLMSIEDTRTTREACRNLLMGAGVNVVLTHADESHLTFLRCHLDEIRDPAGIMSVTKAVKFRVEVRRLAERQADEAGYAVALDIVLEKGSLSSFRLVYKRLRREWDLDAPQSGDVDMVYTEPSTTRETSMIQ